MRFGMVLSSVGNAVAAAIVGTGAIGTLANFVTAPKVAVPCYMCASVAGYCLRRGILHRWPDGQPLGAAEVVRRHLTYESGWHEPDRSPGTGRAIFALHIGLWLALFQPVYPLLEASLYPFGGAAFWFYCDSPPLNFVS